MKWTERDKQRVRQVIDYIADQMGGARTGGKAALARELKQESRAVVQNWYRRGYIPLDFHPRIIALALPKYKLTPSMLSPLARHVTVTMHRVPLAQLP